MKLTVYTDDFKNIKTVYESECYKVPFGVLEDLLNLIDLTGLMTAQTQEQQVKFIFNVVSSRGVGIFKELISKIFGVSVEDVRNTDIFEVVQVVLEYITYITERFANLFTEKNA